MRCPKCRTENLEDSVFCEQCSAPLEAALEGERKQVRVLFADVKGSMEPAEQLDPEAWHRIIARFGELLERADRWFADTGATNLAAFVAREGAGLCELPCDARQRQTWLLRAHDEWSRIGASGRVQLAELELTSARAENSPGEV